MTTTVYLKGKLLPPVQRHAFLVVAFMLFTAYLFFLIKLFFLQIHFHWAAINIVINRNASARQLLAMANVVPFYKILYYARGCEPYSIGLINVAGNIAIFVPMGLALPFFFSGLQSSRQLVKTAAIISLTVEVLQLITATGVFDVDDVLLNTAGAVVGYWLFGHVQKLLWSKAPAQPFAKSRFTLLH